DLYERSFSFIPRVAHLRGTAAPSRAATRPPARADNAAKKSRPTAGSGMLPWRRAAMALALALLRETPRLLGGAVERRDGRRLALERLVQLVVEHRFDTFVIGHAEAAAGVQRLALHRLDDGVRAGDLVVERHIGSTECGIGERQVAGALVPFRGIDRLGQPGEELRGGFFLRLRMAVDRPQRGTADERAARLLGSLGVVRQRRHAERQGTRVHERAGRSRARGQDGALSLGEQRIAL